MMVLRVRQTAVFCCCMMMLMGWMCVGTLYAQDAGARKAAGEFRPIFDGKSLKGWRGEDGVWRVENGVIIGQSTAEKPLKSNAFLFWDQGEVDNFELKLKYRISGTPAANSGIQFRSQDDGEGHAVGYQADIDLVGQWVGILYDERGRGVLATRGQSVVRGPGEFSNVAKFGDADALRAAIDLDGWNEYHILAMDDYIVLSINGQVTAIFTDKDVANQDFAGLLALQLHAGPPMKIEFKDIELKRLPLTDRKKIVFVAGKESHGYGAHEHKAGCMLLAKTLDESGLNVHSVVYTGGWPNDPTAFDNADAVVFYCDGGGNHYANPHISAFREVMDRGVGLACLHYGVEVPKGEAGAAFVDWIGGYFETHWSVNPWWTAEFHSLPAHAITQGVQPFAIHDEWYYHMRFADNMEGVTPILSAVPPASTLDRGDGPHSGNPHVRAKKGQAQHVAWAYERPDGGRGFGFTGGHVHWNWAHDDFRTVVLNALAWTAHIDVPSDGVSSTTPTIKELMANQDYGVPNNFKQEELKKQINAWNGE